MENKLKYDKPATVWEEALPLGNGNIGAMVYGGVDTDIIKLNCGTFWSASPVNRIEYDKTKSLEKLRELIRNEDYVAADGYAKQEFEEGTEAKFLPVGELIIKRLDSDVANGYIRELNLENAEVNIEYGRNTDIGISYNRESTPKDIGGYIFSKRYFASKPHDVLVCDISAKYEKTMSFSFGIDSDLPAKISNCGGMIAMHETAPEDVVYGEFEKNDGGEKNVSCAVAVGVKVTGEQATVEILNNKIMVYNASHITVFLSCVTDFVSYNENPDKSIDIVGKACEKVSKAVNDGVDTVYMAHIKDYKELYNRCVLDLCGDNDGFTDERIKNIQSGGEDTGLIELMFNFGRYLMISASRENSQPMNLQGLWNHRVMPPWRSNYTTNINTPMNYWPAEICNLSECHEPLFKMIEELSEAGEETAGRLYGCRGFCVHHNTTLWRWTRPSAGNSKWMMWPVAGLWLCSHLWKHYEYTLDKDFLYNRAYPVIKKCVLFVIDFLTEENGYLVTSPSTSPENVFLYNNEKCAVSQMSAMDNALVRETLANYINICNICRIDDELKNIAAETMGKLYPLKTGSDGRLLEWNKEFEESEKGHRHLSHLYCVFPSMIVTEKDAEIYEAAKKSLEYRLENGGGHTGWSCGWIINLFAIFGDAENCLKYMNTLLAKSAYANLFDAHPPFQIDGNFAFASGVAQALLQSSINDKGVLIKLLPAKPDSWDKGSVKGICAKGGITADISWSGLDVSVRLTGNTDINVEIQSDTKYCVKVL